MNNNLKVENIRDICLFPLISFANIERDDSRIWEKNGDL